MSLRRFQWHLRRPGVVTLMALLLLVAGFLCLNGVHAVHYSAAEHHHHHHHHHSDAHEHADPGGALTHSHSHSTPSEGDQAENCAICFFHSTPVALDFSSVPVVAPLFIPLAGVSIPADADSGTIIITLWSGRAPPISSVS